MGAFRNNALLLADVAHARIFLFLFQPGELGCELFARRCGHLKLEQEAARSGVADMALEFSEVPEIGGDAIANLADHRHGDNHPERRNAAGTAREGARLALRVKPVAKRGLSTDGDVDSTLIEKLLDRHGAFSG